MSKQVSIRIGISAVLALVASAVFFRILGNGEVLYMYGFYGLLAITMYLLSKFFGKEMYLLAIIPRIFISGNLQLLFFNACSNDTDGQNPLKVHVFTFVWLVIFVLEFIEMVYRQEIRIDWMVGLGVAVVAVFTAVTFVQRGGKGLSLLIENYYAPFSFFLFFYLKKDISLVRLRRYTNLILLCICLLALFGYIEYYYKDNPFTSYFITGGVFRTQTADRYRVAGTVGHILFPQLMLVGCFLAHRNIAKIWLRLPLYAYLMGASALSQTRVTLLIICFYVVVAEVGRIVINEGANLKNLFKPLIAAAALLGTAALVFLQTDVGKRLVERIFSDSGSAEARNIQIDYFFQNMFSMPLYGIGAFADDIVLLDEQGNQVLAEIPWINLYFEVGIFLALLVAFLLMVIFAGKLWFELLVLLAAYTPYTTLTGKTPCYFIFFVLAVYGMMLKRKQKSGAEDTTAQKLYPVFPPGRRAGAAVLLALAILLSGMAGLWAGVQKVNTSKKWYRATAELYVMPEITLEEDLLYTDEQKGGTITLHRYLADDMVRLAATERLTDMMREQYHQQTGKTLAHTDYYLRLNVQNLFESRRLQIAYSDSDPQRAADIANCYANAIMQFAHDTAGFTYIQQTTKARVPVHFYSPRPIALPIIQGLFTALFFTAGYFTLDCLGRLRESYGQPIIIIQKRSRKRG